jgi:hypothetical protein
MDDRTSFNTTYTTVAASQTDQAINVSVGNVGQILERLVVNVTTSATSQVQIKDGNGSAITVVPSNTPVGCYSIEIGAVCRNTTTPGWKVTTAAGVSVIAVGRF